MTGQAKYISSNFDNKYLFPIWATEKAGLKTIPVSNKKIDLLLLQFQYSVRTYSYLGWLPVETGLT